MNDVVASHADPGGTRRRLSNVWLVSVGVVGAVLAVMFGGREYLVAQSAARLRMESQVAVHLTHLQSHLTDRENLARVIAYAFELPAIHVANALSQFDQRLLELVPDITSFVWVPRVPAQRAAEVLAALNAAGHNRPTFLGPSGQPLATIGDIVFPIFDIMPKTAANVSSLGLNLAVLPHPRAALQRADEDADISGTAPLHLVQLPGVLALVLYVPIFREGEPVPRGYLGFSYRFDRLLGAAMARIGDSELGVRITDEDAGGALLFTTGAGEGEELVRELRFGGRTWRATYQSIGSRRNAPLLQAASVSAIAFALVIAVLVVIWMQLRAREKLEVAVKARAEAEGQLRVVVEELNHRGRNIFAVLQTLIDQTLRHAPSLDAAKAALQGRIEAMAQSSHLLSESEWRGARIDDIVARSGLPFADRVHARGEDVILAPGVTQSIVLVLHELWTNAAKHGALSHPDGHVDLEWSVRDGEFVLRWTEHGKAVDRLPDRSGFGRRLIERLGPHGLGGSASLEGSPTGIVYQLRAPAARVLAADQE